MGRKNPMRWKCGEDGCFNQKMRPKLEQFAELFPGNIGMSDVDAMVEINGHFLYLEWKSEMGKLPLGQSIAFTRRTQGPILKDCVIIIAGDAESMEVVGFKWFYNGVESKWAKGDMAAVREFIKRWVLHARKNKIPR